MLRIRVTNPDGTVRTLPLNRPQFAIGRTGDNDLVLHDEMVSGHHCVIETHGHTLVLTDRGSRNGTWVNQVRLEAPVRIDEQSRIYVGGHLIELERDREAFADKPIGPVGPLLVEAG